MLNRLRLRRDPTLFAPSYAVLLGRLVSSAIGFGLSQAELVRTAALLVIGVSAVLGGLHLVLYRHEHTELMKERFGLTYHHPFTFTVIGVAVFLMGVATATFAYLGLAHR